MTTRRRRKTLDEPNMSDKTLLVTLEDLINMAMGPPDQNTINYKMLQTVLQILARQLRLLETHVEVRVKSSMFAGKKARSPRKKGKGKGEKDKSGKGGVSGEDLSSDEDEGVRGKSKKDKEVKEKGKGKGKDGGRESERDDQSDREGRDKSRDREDPDKGRGKESRDKSRDKEDREKDDRDKSRDRDRGRDSDRDDRDKAKDKSDEKGKKDRGTASRDDGADREKDRGENDKDKVDKISLKGKDRGGAREPKIETKTTTEKAFTKTEKRGKAGQLLDRDEASWTTIKEMVVTTTTTTTEVVDVVEKGPTTRASHTRVGSIEVVTLSQFELLTRMVEDLQNRAGPMPPITMPDNQKLKKDLVKGTASLTDTMQAMQVNARVQAAEEAIGRMAGLLTQLAAAGALPQDVLGKLDQLDLPGSAGAAAKAAAKGTGAAGTSGKGAGKGKGGVDRGGADKGGADRDADWGGERGEKGGDMGVDRIGGRGVGTDGGGGGGWDDDDEKSMRSRGAGTGPSRKSVAIDPMSTSRAEGTGVKSKAGLGGSAVLSRPSVASIGRASLVSRPSMMSGMPGVTHKEMDEAIRLLKEQMLNNMTNMTTKSSQAAETAAITAKTLSDKLDTAMKLDQRITTLNSLVSDYAEQLSGFDAGLISSMQSFQEQMIQMRNELHSGLAILEQANNNAETAAVMELNERFDGLASEMDLTMHSHQGLSVNQNQLTDELRSLAECVEMLREQKADRDEVQDGLRDKADNYRLNGLLTEVEFAAARAELDHRLSLCHDKFKKQESTWLVAMRELNEAAEAKAEIMQLLALREDAQQQLRNQQKMLKQLEIQLGEPKAAMLMRKLARDAMCGVCAAPALMEAYDAARGAPPALPALRPRPTPTPALVEGPCLTALRPPPPPDAKAHICHRWVGGSHTLISESVRREQAAAPVDTLLGVPYNKYAGTGTDGKLYRLEEEMEPCGPCNKWRDLPVDQSPVCGPEQGGGDQTHPNDAIPIEELAKNTNEVPPKTPHLGEVVPKKEPSEETPPMVSNKQFTYEAPPATAHQSEVIINREISNEVPPTEAPSEEEKGDSMGANSPE